MIRNLTFALSLLGIVCASLADSFRLEGLQGQKFSPSTNTVIIWKATNDLPDALWIYKTVPQAFSMVVISNAMSLCGFDWKHLSKKPDSSVPDKDLIRFSDKKVNWTRSLLIAPNLGWMEYNAATDPQDLTNGVPTKEEADKLALGVLFQFGIDRSLLSNKQIHQTVQGKLSREGERLTTNVVNRGVSYTRLIDGVESKNSSGFTIDFESHARITHFWLNWRNILPTEVHPTLSTNEIVKLIKAGNSLAAPWGNLDDLKSAKTISVVKITPRYFEVEGKKPMYLMYPFATLEMVADLDGTNTETFNVQCPVLSPNTFSIRNY
jgi:hypothetical protein